MQHGAIGHHGVIALLNVAMELNQEIVNANLNQVIPQPVTLWIGVNVTVGLLDKK